MTSTRQDVKGHYAAVNGLEMYYEIHGFGRPLVLLHGAFGSAEGWATILPKLSETRQVICPEQQGHGHTADRDAPLRYEQMADDTAALLRHLNITRADIFGFSDGGVVAFALAMRHSGLVRKLAVLGANTGKLEDVYDSEVYEQFKSLPADFAPEVLKATYDKVAPDPSRWPVLVSKIREMGLDFSGYAANEVAAISAPTLILQGDRDAPRPEHAVEIYRLIPNAQIAIFPSEDHLILWSSPEKVLTTLFPFLDAPLPDTESMEDN